MGKKKAAAKSGAASIAITEDAPAAADDGKKVTKSSLIRDYLANNPGVQNKGVAEALNADPAVVAKGFSFKASDVAQVKVNANNKAKKGGKAPAMKLGRKPQAPATNGQHTGAAAAVQAAASLIKAAGGPTEAQAVLAAMIGVMN